MGNPLIYRDPSGHTPEWLIRATGAFAQYADDVSLGLYSALVGDLGKIDNVAYQEGREIGRTVSAVQGAYEVAHGAASVIIGLTAGPPTATAGAACTAGTAGACAVPTSIALTAEGAMVIGGTVEAAHGGLMLAKINKDPIHHIATNKNRKRNPQWTKRFETLFDKGGMSLEDAANKIPLPGHAQRAPHSQGYHQWVHDRLSNAISGLEKQGEIAAALRRELDAIADALEKNPNLLRQP